MMKTKQWNWLTFLERAVKKEPSEYAYFRARQKAVNWPTCACGQLCRKLPRMQDRSIGRPRDVIAAWLGYEFTSQVLGGKWTEALTTFHRIEARTAVLLKKQGKK